MDPLAVFEPPRRSGIVFHTAAIAASLLGGTVSLFYALTKVTGTEFVLVLFLALALYAPLPLLLYRGYALLRAGYVLERDGLRIRWGLRGQDIPLPEIEWVRPAAELGFHLPLPWLPWPGAVLGSRNVQELGQVEFMASTTHTMLLLATSDRVYAISPADPRAFIRAFQRAMEYGSLSPLPAYSARPAAFLQRVWQDRTARIPLLVSLVLTAGLLVFTALMIPSRTVVSIGFDPTGQPYPPGPPERLLLLPILAGFAFIVDLLAGLYFYRWEVYRPVAYLLWFGSPLAPLLLLLTLAFFLR